MSSYISTLACIPLIHLTWFPSVGSAGRRTDRLGQAFSREPKYCVGAVVICRSVLDSRHSSQCSVSKNAHIRRIQHFAYTRTPPNCCARRHQRSCARRTITIIRISVGVLSNGSSTSVYRKNVRKINRRKPFSVLTSPDLL